VSRARGGAERWGAITPAGAARRAPRSARARSPSTPPPTGRR
jgi:hypothetical protein